MIDKTPCVYILTSNNNSVLYIGVTSQLPQRIWQHKNGVVEGFTKKYNVHKLVYFELFDDMANAINREKQLKQWKREWKLALVRETNPNFLDLSTEYQ
ncbi:GIY-YIG nuclease family protein [Vibrio alginolyticus]|uniref:GIY-YIG nuclease family protein n=1 Tax=Vibrio alginolyticus TaxID=663 RepID=UPI0037553CA7